MSACSATAAGSIKMNPTQADILRSGGCAQGLAGTDVEYVKISNLDAALRQFCLPTTTVGPKVTSGLGDDAGPDHSVGKPEPPPCWGRSFTNPIIAVPRLNHPPLQPHSGGSLSGPVQTGVRRR